MATSPPVAAPASPRNPRRVQAARASARRRWAEHTPRIVKLDTLSIPQRELVMALVRAAREQAPADDETADEEAQGAS